jgi:hypothetical protein
VDEFAQTLITSWPSATTGVDLGFDDCLCHYFGGLIPSEAGKVGLGIPDGQLAALAARPARPGAAAGPRQRICDGYGLQLETANMPGDHINERSCAIRDVVARDLRGASTETTGLFAHVLPQAVLARPRAGITPDITAPTRVGMPAQAAGAPP